MGSWFCYIKQKEALPTRTRPDSPQLCEHQQAFTICGNIQHFITLETLQEKGFCSRLHQVNYYKMLKD